MLRKPTSASPIRTHAANHIDSRHSIYFALAHGFACREPFRGAFLPGNTAVFFPLPRPLFLSRGCTCGIATLFYRRIPCGIAKAITPGSLQPVP